MRLYGSEQEIKNYLEKLNIDQIKEMLEFKPCSDEFKFLLLKEYWSRINGTIDGDEE